MRLFSSAVALFVKVTQSVEAYRVGIHGVMGAPVEGAAVSARRWVRYSNTRVWVLPEPALAS